MLFIKKTGKRKAPNIYTRYPGIYIYGQKTQIIVGLGGGSTAAAVTLDTVADESRKKMADGVARSPSRLCSWDGKVCCYGDALSMSTIFLLAFVPCFLLFVFVSFSYFFLHPGMFIFVSLCLCGSHLLLSASTYFIVRVLSARVICTLPHLGILLFFIRLVFFRSSCFSGGVFLLYSRTRYASTWFAYLDSWATFGFCLSHCLWPQNLYL